MVDIAAEVVERYHAWEGQATITGGCMLKQTIIFDSPEDLEKFKALIQEYVLDRLGAVPWDEKWRVQEVIDQLAGE